MKKQIYILGGGSAGWLTALFVKKVWGINDVSVIEDPDTPPIIAGEAGSASLNNLYNYLDIDITEWITSVNAMPKLGGRFVDWNEKGKDFVHGLIPAWYNLNYKAEYPEFGEANDFLSATLALDISTENIFYNSRLCRENKLPLTPSNDNSMFNVLTLPMWHFDSRANADYLKTLGISRGINLIEAKFLSANLDLRGNVDELILDKGSYNCDWVFDCSGFARLLLGKVYNTSFVDYSNYFPACAVLGWWTDTPELKNHTVMSAMDYGWSWNINLKHRQGNGYIYDPSCINFDQALQEAEQKYKQKIEPVANLKFTPGILAKSWVNNVIGIGLSTGFLEPLESNGLAAVAEQLKLLSNHWSPGSTSYIAEQTYNKKYIAVMEDISDFLSLHYRGQREDTEFWKDHKYNKDRVSDRLNDKLNLWSNGILGVDDTEIYGIENYAVVVQGLDLINKDKLYNNLLLKRENIIDSYKQHYNNIAKEIDHIVKICYTIEEWKNKIYEKN